MSTLPSKSRVDKLGKKLAAGELSSDELAELQNVRGCWNERLGEIQAMVEHSVSHFGLQCTGRIKNLGTVADKIRRKGTALSRMRDVVGCRVIVDRGGRVRQDEVIAKLREDLADLSPSEPIDRRVNPIQGYRAVHLEVTSSDGVRCEIQVRTLLQHLFAEASERLGDVIGRGFRYGDDPDWDALGADIGRLIRRFMVALDELSNHIEEQELLDVQIAEKYGALDTVGGPNPFVLRLQLRGLQAQSWLAKSHLRSSAQLAIQTATSLTSLLH